MNVKNVRRVRAPPSPRGFRSIVKFNWAPLPGLLIYDMQLVRGPEGQLLVYGPHSPNGSPTISLSPERRAELLSIITLIEDAEIETAIAS